MKKRCTAIVLAAGSGSRMKSTTAKQFMLLGGKPIIWYSLQALEQSEIIDDCILVTGAADIPYVEAEIVERYGFSKVDCVIAGGSERWESVVNAMKIIEERKMKVPNCDGYVFVHDGARPFLTEAILQSTLQTVERYHACVAAVPSKDTVKLADEEGFAAITPDRRTVWLVQTPQVFDTELIVGAYGELRKQAERNGKQSITVTDDASVVELFTDCPVKFAESEYTNIKITTPEDIKIAETFLNE